MRTLPDLSPEQVVQLQDALLANADALLSSALMVLDGGHAALARSLAVLGLEESGKAIAVHERRIQMTSAPEGEPFRCVWLDELWANHRKKLEHVHGFLLLEPYWFGTGEPDHDQNAVYLGTIKAWARRNDLSKQRGSHVELSKDGTVLAPADVADEDALREVIARVHQIGWQLRLGEHIEGKRQDEQEVGTPPSVDDDLSWMRGEHWNDSPPEVRRVVDDLIETIRRGVPGVPLTNAGYRFNPPGADRNPFRNLGRPGYEAETRKLMWLQQSLDEQAETDLAERGSDKDRA